MPRYRCVNAKVELYAANLGAATTTAPEHRKCPATMSNVLEAEKVLRNGRALAETVVGVPLENGEDGGRVHFLGKYGNMPFLMVHAGAGLFTNNGGQELPTRRTSDHHSISSTKSMSQLPASREVDNKGEKDKYQLQDDARSLTSTRGKRPIHSSDTDNAPQALCVQVFIAPETFLFDPAPTLRDANRDVKIDVFFNGHWADAQFIPGRNRTNKNRAVSQIFAGERCGYLVERPWVIVPPEQEADGSLRATTMKSKALKSVTAEERWNQIGAALLAEADGQGFNKSGYRPPSGEYLESLANLQMPGAVEAMQKPGGPTFGVIDVIISVGQGQKMLGSSAYIQVATRFKDDRFKPLTEEQRANNEEEDRLAEDTMADPIQPDSRPGSQPDPVQELPQPTHSFPSNSAFQTPNRHLLPNSSPPYFLRDFLLSKNSSFSDHYPSPDDGRHKRGQMRVSSLGGKGVATSQLVDLDRPTRTGSDRRFSLSNSTPNVTLRSRQNSLDQPTNPLNLMPPPLAPASSSSAISPKKRRRGSLPTPDGAVNKRRRVSERIQAARPSVESTQLPVQNTPPSSVGISRRGVFTENGSPTAISFPSASNSGRRDSKILLEGDPFEPRIQLPAFNNPFSSPSGLPLGLSGIPTTRINRGYSLYPQPFHQPSVIINRVVIKAAKTLVVDKFLTTGYHLALPTIKPRSPSPVLPPPPPPPPPPPRRSSRIQRSETPGSAPYVEASSKSSRAQGFLNKDPATPPPSSSPLKNASAAQGRRTGSNTKVNNRAKTRVGNVPEPTYLLSQIRSRQNFELSPADAAKMEHVVRVFAEQTSPNSWGLMKENGRWAPQVNQGLGASQQQLSSNAGAFPRTPNTMVGTPSRQVTYSGGIGSIAQMPNQMAGFYSQPLSHSSGTVNSPRVPNGFSGSGFIPQPKQPIGMPAQQLSRSRLIGNIPPFQITAGFGGLVQPPNRVIGNTLRPSDPRQNKFHREASGAMKFTPQTGQAISTPQEQSNHRRGSSPLQSGGAIKLTPQSSQDITISLQQVYHRRASFPKQPNEMINLTPQSSFSDLEHGNFHGTDRADGVGRMTRSNMKDTIQVKPRVADAPAIPTIPSAAAKIPLAGAKSTTPVPNSVVQKHRDSLGTEDSPLSSAQSNLSTPKHFGSTPPTQTEGKEEDTKESKPQSVSKASRGRRSGQAPVEQAPVDVSLLGEDCVITFAKPGPWSAMPTGEVLRQVRGAKPGIFREEEVVFGVRFLLG